MFDDSVAHADLRLSAWPAAAVMLPARGTLLPIPLPPFPASFCRPCSVHKPSERPDVYLRPRDLRIGSTLTIFGRPIQVRRHGGRRWRREVSSTLCRVTPVTT
jgi:hypothetical protein